MSTGLRLTLQLQLQFTKINWKNKATYVKYFIFHSTEFSSYTLFPQWNF